MRGNGLGWPECACNVGVRPCALHPGRLLSKEQKIEFRKEWDARVERGSK